MFSMQQTHEHWRCREHVHRELDGLRSKVARSTPQPQPKKKKTAASPPGAARSEADPPGDASKACSPGGDVEAFIEDAWVRMVKKPARPNIRLERQVPQPHPGRSSLPIILPKRDAEGTEEEVRDQRGGSCCSAAVRQGLWRRVSSSWLLAVPSGSGRACGGWCDALCKAPSQPRTNTDYDSLWDRGSWGPWEWAEGAGFRLLPAPKSTLWMLTSLSTRLCLSSSGRRLPSWRGISTVLGSTRKPI